MTAPVPEEIALIAGRGIYPLVLAASAKKQGVKRLFAIAFSGETDRALESLVDEIVWMPFGLAGHVLDTLKQSGIKHLVMAGLIAPTHLFRIRLDAKALQVLRELPQKNAHTIFGALVREIKAIGMDVLPASTFMEDHMPGAGLLSQRAPTEREQSDIELGLKVAAVTSGLDVGQTVVIKDGTILAVEAFEGTDVTIRRAAKLGGPGIVVVKVAKRGHDMRFDIPMVGLRTLRVLKKARAAALAVQAGRAILLETDKIVQQADKQGLCLLVTPVLD